MRGRDSKQEEREGKEMKIGLVRWPFLTGHLNFFGVKLPFHPSLIGEKRPVTLIEKLGFTNYALKVTILMKHVQLRRIETKN